MPEVLGTDPGTGISGFGTKLQGATQGAIGMITKITIVGQEADEYDVTTMNAPSKYKKFIAGLIDAKEITLELIYEPTNMAVLLAAVGAANENWTVTFPDTCTFVCSGHIKNLGTPIPFNDKITQTATIRLSGPPTFHVPSGVV